MKEMKYTKNMDDTKDMKEMKKNERDERGERDATDERDERCENICRFTHSVATNVPINLHRASSRPKSTGRKSIKKDGRYERSAIDKTEGRKKDVTYTEEMKDNKEMKEVD